MRSLTAFRMVVHDRSSTAGALLGVVAIVFLVGQPLSILFGLLTYMSVLVDHSGADAWVMSANLRHADAGNLVAARYMDRIVGWPRWTGSTASCCRDWLLLGSAERGGPAGV